MIAATWSASTATTSPHAPPYLPYEIITALRRLLYIVGYASWGLLLAAYLSSPRSRRSPNTLHVMLLVALASALLASATLYPLPSFTRLFDQDAPLWGLVMIFLAPLLFLLSLPEPTCLSLLLIPTLLLPYRVVPLLD